MRPCAQLCGKISVAGRTGRLHSGDAKGCSLRPCDWRFLPKLRPPFGAAFFCCEDAKAAATWCPTPSHYLPCSTAGSESLRRRQRRVLIAASGQSSCNSDFLEHSISFESVFIERRRRCLCRGSIFYSILTICSRAPVKTELMRFVTFQQ